MQPSNVCSEDSISQLLLQPSALVLILQLGGAISPKDVPGTGQRPSSAPVHKTKGLQEVKTLGPQNREMDAMPGTLWPIPGSKEQPGSSKPEMSHSNKPHACLASTV